MTDMTLPPAVDLSAAHLTQRLEAFLSGHWAADVEVSDLRRYPAGMSWITVGFTATRRTGPAAAPDRQELILRIGDPGGLLAPYRAEPEYLVLEALASVDGLPVPKVHAFSDRHDLIGAPFLITGRVEGDTPMPWKGAQGSRSAAHNLSLGRDFADGLAAIHAFDWRTTPLARLWSDVRAETAALDQVTYWARHAGLAGAAGATDSSKSMPAMPPMSPIPQLHYVMRWLQRHAPVAAEVTIVHGDYRVGNFLQQDGRITAILDWELMHAGDPHEDIAWAGLKTFSAGSSSHVGGLIERAEFLERYTARTGFTVRPEVVRYYEVLVQFKMAAMLIGAMRRVESGQSRDVRMASMGFQLAPTLLELNRLIAELS